MVNNKQRMMTIVGTRPEIIRLAPTIKRLDECCNHILVHTGQNYDYELNQVFFEDLGLRKPDYFLEADTSSLGNVLGSILVKTEQVLIAERPDAMLILGDTNSSIAAVIAKRLKVPVFHMEAGNRSFDENVPEETNRRLVDHVSDYNLVYTEHARRNLLAEGIHPSRIALTGSPMREVLRQNSGAIESSDVLGRQGLVPNGYFLVSIHREETVDDSQRLTDVLETLQAVSTHFCKPVLVSTHPRTRKQLCEQPQILKENLNFHTPFGFNDYIKLQQNARLVLSDSGTIAEESALLEFPAVTLRDFIERPEAIEAGSIMSTGLKASDVLDSMEITLAQYAQDGVPDKPADYLISDTSRRAVNFIRSTVQGHKDRTGIRHQATIRESN